ncbi:glycosyltransferase [Zobellia nedashkovskayae]|uniref:glycosyltransferase n=1 Tax=Zobellia nedashkovskayae TaxID=2779510 RepID=UPI00188A97BF|nr:glycosyltransferase [Zobellia nedashkovskayae]
MKIIFLNHHNHLRGYSMNRYANFLDKSMTAKGHDSEIWHPKPYLAKTYFPKTIRKWLIYVDQFILFPLLFLIKSKQKPKDTLYVLVDQALGIWMPLLKNKKHIVHCHDFIALKSSLGLIKENPTSWTGKIYQRSILKGFSKAQNFISVSKHTQKELVKFLKREPAINEQVYNALDPMFIPGSVTNARIEVSKHVKHNLEQGYLLHVGGNGFYKNRIGLIALYTSWRAVTNKSLPLLLIGYPPSKKIYEASESSQFKNDIYFLTNADNHLLLQSYQGASMFLFPSLFEGFGWPVAEAMASGCPVITTNEAPMNEVGGNAAFFIERCPSPEQINAWAHESAQVLEKALSISSKEKNDVIAKGLINAQRFNEDKLTDEIEQIYLKIEKAKLF